MADHADLSPSGASRWLICTKSVALEKEFPDTESYASKEGTCCHKLGELYLQKDLRMKSVKLIKHKIEKVQAEVKKLIQDQPTNIRPDFKTVWADIQRYAGEYRDFVLEVLSEAEAEDDDTHIFLEKRYYMTRWIPESFGTGDTSILNNVKARFIDLKYGKGVPVGAEENPQLMIYALGLYQKFGRTYDFTEFDLYIFQPRLSGGITKFTITVKKLLKWAEEYLRPRAALAYADEGEFVPSEKTCKFCRAKARCEALAKYNLDLLKHDFQIEGYLEEEGFLEALEKGKLLVDWYNAVEKYALNEALNGKKWPGFKLVHGRSNRKYSNERMVAATLRMEGYSFKDLYTKKLLTITNMERFLGKQEFYDLLKDYVVKGDGAPALVPEHDARRPYQSAEHDFSDEFDDFE